MSRLEDELREALRREDPGGEFTRRTLQRAAALKPRESVWRRWLRTPVWRWAPVGALACAMLVFSAVERHRVEVEREQGERAKAQLVMALRITGAKLHSAQVKVVQQLER